MLERRFLMLNDPNGGNPIDRFTLWMMRQASRRRFLGVAGASGLAVLGLIPGLKHLTAVRGLAQVQAVSLPAAPDSLNCNDASDCAAPCEGICNCQYSSCITGGRSCYCDCPSACGDCLPSPFVKAVGTWQCTLGHCYFSCTCPAC